MSLSACAVCTDESPYPPCRGSSPISACLIRAIPTAGSVRLMPLGSTSCAGVTTRPGVSFKGEAMSA